MNAQEWLEELEYFAKEATPGPWTKSEQGTNETYHHRIERYYGGKEVPEHIAYIVLPHVFGNLNDAAYIVAACNAVPRLVEMVKYLSEKSRVETNGTNTWRIRESKTVLQEAYEATDPKRKTAAEDHSNTLEWNNNPTKVKELAGGELIMESDNEYKVKGYREITNGERKVGEVIHQAMLRCFSGKGKERHNIEGTVDFMDQPLMEISRRVGIGGPLYQVHKKAYEAHDMVRKGDKDRARNELLDIIIYTAATVLLLDEQKEDK